jgi:hypothetical protein
MATLAALISTLRSLGNDTPASNSIRQEVPIGKTDSINVNFRLQNWPVVSGSVYLTIGTTLGFGLGPYGGVPFGGATGGIVFRTQTGFTVDLANGIITMADGGVPVPNIQPFEFDYNYYWFSDSEYTEFMAQAVLALGIIDPTLVPTGLIPSLLQYALHYYWMRRSSQYAHKYNSSGGTAGHSVEVVTKAFEKLAADAWAAAPLLRDDYYKKQGRQFQPSSGTATYKIDPFTPIR